MCYPRLPPGAATTCPRLCSSLGRVGLVTLGHRVGRTRPQTLCGGCPAVHWSGGITLHPIMLQGVSEAPLAWSNSGKSSSCWRRPPQSHSAGGAWLQGCAGMGAQEGTQAAHGALGMQHSLCGTLRKGLSDKEIGQCHTPGFRVAQSPLQPRGKALFRGEAKLPLSTERGPAAAPHPYQHLRPARWPLQLHAPPPSPRGSGGRDRPKQPSPPWQPESQTRTRHVLAARHVE